MRGWRSQVAGRRDHPDHRARVGPTESVRTGACAAAVAAMSYGGAARDVQVVSPGGTQRVEWREEGLFLTGWAEVLADVTWVGPTGEPR